jgi:AraC family transcriptional regulator
MNRVHDDITLGRRKTSRLLGALALHEVAYPRGWSAAPHSHAHANLTFVCRGAIEESVRRGEEVLRACHAVVKPAGVVHGNRCGPDGADTLVVEFPGESFLGLEPRDREFPSYATLWGPEVARAALRTRALVRGARPDAGSAADELREIVLETLGLVARERDPSRGTPRWLATARGLLHAGFAAPLRVQDLARELRLHPVYLARAFRRGVGCSVTAYRRRLQLSDAARRLAGGDEPLAAVAQRSGFADQSHLSRAFRAGVGVPPSLFRRRMRGGA